MSFLMSLHELAVGQEIKFLLESSFLCVYCIATVHVTSVVALVVSLSGSPFSGYLE